jgi:nucleoside 2-deoxyribosyltransferase
MRPADASGAPGARPIRVYIAAPYPTRAIAIRVMQRLEDAGIDVTSRWLRVDDEPTDAYARQDLADVAAADLLLALNVAGWEDKGTGGRHVELGYALALQKPILLVGARSNIFHHLAAVTVVSPMDEIAAHVQAVARAAGPSLGADDAR